MSTEEDLYEDNNEAEQHANGDASSGSRARNRTVMLTPEITGEVRARLAQDLSATNVSEGIPGMRRAAVPTSERPVGQVARPAMGGMPSITHKPELSSHTVDPDPVTQLPPKRAVEAPRAEAPQHSAAVSSAASYRVREGVMYTRNSPVAGFLVSYDKDENGEVFELRMGRLIVTSEPPSAGNYLVIEDKTVSSMHAILRMSGYSEIQILDQLSEFGTRIIRADDGQEEDLSGEKSVLRHGDKVVFGEREFFVCIISRGE